MLNCCDFIQVYVFTTNHHLKIPVLICSTQKVRRSGKTTLSGAPPIKKREEVTIRFFMIADVSSYSYRNVIQEFALSQLKKSVGFNLNSVRHF